MAPFRNSHKPFRPVLFQTGENIFEVEPELGHRHHNLRKKISAAQAWPIAGDWRVKDFIMFPMLPKELRQKIFRFAVTASQPRVINIYVVQGRLQCNVVNPKIIHACSESRQEALLAYNPLVLNGVFSGTYVNFDIDWVYFETSLPLLKVFGDNADYPIFQKSCRKLALENGLLGLYGKKSLDRFARLEEVAVVHKSNGSYYDPVNSLSQVPNDGQNWHVDSMRQNLQAIVDKVPGIKFASIVDVERKGAPRIMSDLEKERTRIKRQRERELVAPVKIDEDAAHVLQWKFDHRQAGLEEEALAAEAAARASDLDEEDVFDEDEFGMAYGMNPEIFSEDFMIG